MADDDKAIEASKSGLSVPKPPEGEMVAIVVGSKDGPLDMFLSSNKGWHFLYQEYNYDPHKVTVLDEVQKWELYPDRENGITYFTPKPDFFEREAGIVWVGPKRAMKIPKIKYSKWEKKEGGTVNELVSKDRVDSPFFFFQYNMAIPAFKVEVLGNFTIDVIVNIVLRIRNPYKALFYAGGFESLVYAAVVGRIREYVGSKDFNTLRGEHETGNEGLTVEIMALTQSASSAAVSPANTRVTLAKPQTPLPTPKNKGLLTEFGLEIIYASFVQFDIVSEDERAKASLIAGEIAKNDAATAKIEAEATETRGRAAANVAKMLSDVYGPDGAARVREAELIRDALVNTKASTVVMGGSGNTPPIAVNTGGNQNPQQSTQPSKPRPPRPIKKK